MTLHQHGSHLHHHCHHCKHYCNDCSITYCCLCGEEWGRGYNYPFTVPTYTPNYPTITFGTATSDAICKGHSHG